MADDENGKSSPNKSKTGVDSQTQEENNTDPEINKSEENNINLSVNTGEPCHEDANSTNISTDSESLKNSSDEISESNNSPQEIDFSVSETDLTKHSEDEQIVTAGDDAQKSYSKEDPHNMENNDSEEKISEDESGCQLSNQTEREDTNNIPESEYKSEPDLTKQGKKSKNRIEELLQEIEILNENIAQKNNEIDSLRKEKNEVEKRSYDDENNLTEYIKELENELKDFKNKDYNSQSFLDENKKLNDELSQVKSENKELWTKLSSIKDELMRTNIEYNAKEKECNVLKSLKENTEIMANFFTLVHKEKELKDTLIKGYQKLIELNVVKSDDVDYNLPLKRNVNYLFDLCTNLKIKFDEYVRTTDALSNEKQNTINVFTSEINNLKATIVDRAETIENLEKQLAEMAEVKETVSRLQEEILNLKSVNDIIIKEKQSYAELLMKSDETIKKNNTDLDKMTSDILVLRESVKNNSTVIENLSAEVKTLKMYNEELKVQLDDKSKECSNLGANINSHIKTAEIQTSIIIRLDKQKTEDEKALRKVKQQLETLTDVYTKLLNDSEMYKADVEELRKGKDVLKGQISDLEATIAELNNRLTITASEEFSRRCRENTTSFKRRCSEDKQYTRDERSVDSLNSSGSSLDNADKDVSNRGTPARVTNEREVFPLSQSDQVKLMDYLTPKGRVSAGPHVGFTRTKRQSFHDLHRTQAIAVADAATETGHDLWSHQVERDFNYRPSVHEDNAKKEAEYLRVMIQKLSHEKAIAEQQLLSVSTSMHVATGSVMNQQLSNVLKENQKLRHILSRILHNRKKKFNTNENNEDLN
ncbi:uncharacterized protein LOC142974305 isoform X2 [Anticarsia gemmatalis]|uniref:uncharacterized protein LOC142974305 isoform X2 n=1 Tax=Anticarsia gemmatalis TaxID=129554 RepID=UPI003F770954